MKLLLRLCGLLLVLAVLPSAWGQASSLKVSKIDIKHIGPPPVSDELIRANIRTKPGQSYPTLLAISSSIDDDIHNLYATGQFYHIRVARELTADGVALTYVVQGNPRLTAI